MDCKMEENGVTPIPVAMRTAWWAVDPSQLLSLYAVFQASKLSVSSEFNTCALWTAKWRRMESRLFRWQWEQRDELGKCCWQVHRRARRCKRLKIWHYRSNFGQFLRPYLAMQKPFSHFFLKTHLWGLAAAIEVAGCNEPSLVFVSFASFDGIFSCSRLGCQP